MKNLRPRPIAVVGLLGLSFTGCQDDTIVDTCADTGCDTTSITTEDDPTRPPTFPTSVPTFPTTTNYCGTRCYYEDDGYYPTTYYETLTTFDTDYTTTITTDYCDDYGCYEDEGPYTSYTSYTSYTTIETETDTVSTIPDTDTIFTDTTATETDTDTTTGTETDTDTDTDTSTGGEDAFPPLGVFGDDIIELDLVGAWSLQWAPDATTPDSVITIDANGEFIWRETSADCTSDTLATGVLWVEPGQIVMHLDTWERQLPWDTIPVMGQEFPAPFRLRMSYALLGTNLMLAATDRITAVEPYAGRAYLQNTSQGLFIAGQYIGETELMAVVDGEPLARVIVRDRLVAALDAEPGVTPESTGTFAHDQTWYGVDPPLAGPTLFEISNWTCLDGCPLPAGATLINGGNLYAYGPYAGFQRLATFASGRTFRRDLDTDCP